MRPIVAVIGTTGVGKSQLAVHLAQSCAGASSKHAGLECPPSTGIVLSADSMQLYKGLDTITNKVTAAEMGGVEHWGLDVVEPGRESSWELGRWCSEADSVVDNLPQSTLPIVCGGTHYFIQHFLFPPPELSTSRPSARVEGDTGAGSSTAASSRWTPPCPLPPVPDLDSASQKLLQTFWQPEPAWPPEALHQASDRVPRLAGAAGWTDAQLLSLHRLLAAVNPNEAARWHWRDGRKVKRGLERWWETGGQLKEDDKPTAQGRKARFRTLIFWVYESMPTLRPRLDRRVDRMIENGLLREISELRDIAKEVYGSVDAADHTEGIFQAIGYKEFTTLPIDPDSTSDPSAHPAFQSMLDRMKLSTHQYAKSQLKWIAKQLLPAVREARQAGGEVWVYVVAGGEANEQTTQDILTRFLLDATMPDPPTVGHPDARELLAILDPLGGDVNIVPNIAKRQIINARKECSICSTSVSPYSVMEKDWDQHLTSKLHKRNLIAHEGGRELVIERQKQAGLAKKAHRERLKRVLDAGSAPTI